MKYPSKLKRIREERGLTQEDIAEAINTSRQNISNWELDLSCIKLGIAIKLADYLDVTLDYLAGRDFKKTYKEKLVEELRNIDVEELANFIIKHKRKKQVKQ